MHQADGRAIEGGTAVKVNPLNEGTGTVADADNGNTNFSHVKKEILPATSRLGQDASSRFRNIKVKVKISLCEASSDAEQCPDLGVETDVVRSSMQAL